ncbi:MAG: GNAT family N-acetyltransferase [Cyclobacteriaceae bacterium]|nr:GNAT family N-acetyltransferase [Cyclobacteriaceae bacterium]
MQIKGYYTLSNCSIPLSSFPYEIQKKLPNAYSFIPATLLGRLAVDKKHQGKKIGKIFLIDALKRSFDISKEIASFAVAVDPIDEAAERFYRKFDFIKLPGSEKMFIAMNTLKHLFY